MFVNKVYHLNKYKTILQKLNIGIKLKNLK